MGRSDHRAETPACARRGSTSRISVLALRSRGSRLLLLCSAAALIALCFISFGGREAGAQNEAPGLILMIVNGPGRVQLTPPGRDPGGAVVSTCENSMLPCRFVYEPGTVVTVSATAKPGGRFEGWSDPDCPPTPSCAITTADDLVSLVATFSPLTLRVQIGAGTGLVTSDPPGIECPIVCVAKFDLGTEITLRGRSLDLVRWDFGCTALPGLTTDSTCRFTISDDLAEVGVALGPGITQYVLPSVLVSFRLNIARSSGTGQVRVRVGVDSVCRDRCSYTTGFGGTATFTAEADAGSEFDRWIGGPCGMKAECTLRVGPITAMTAVFTRDVAAPTRDVTAPTAPGPLTVNGSTRSSLAMSWIAATDNVKVTGYRIYVDGAPFGETQGTTFTLQGLRCGRAYAIAVDAVDALGNRSPRAAVSVQTAPCALAVRLAGVGVSREGSIRILVATIRSNRETTAQLRLLRGRRVVVSSRYRIKPGTNKLRLRVPKRIQRGSYRVVTTLVDPDGGTLVLPSRGVLLPKP
jgi:hypothetical protein